MTGNGTVCYGWELVFGLGRVSVQRGWMVMDGELCCLLSALGIKVFLRVL